MSEPDPQERLITSMEFSGTNEPEERIAVLEQKMTEMDGLVNGLIAEFLDLKAVGRTMSRDLEERNRQDLRWTPVAQVTPSQDTADQADQAVSSSPAVHSDGTTVIRPRAARQPDVPAVPAEPVMVRIMQTDGTMKLEPRYGETNHIDSTGGYGRNRKDAAMSRQSPLIYAADKEKSDSAKI